MSDAKLISKLAYITLNGRIPSRTANSVGVMKMCGQFSAQGIDVTLIVPNVNRLSLDALGFNGDVFDFYSVAKKFNLVRFVSFFGLLAKLPIFYSLLMILYAYFIKRVHLVTTRCFEAAVWAELFCRPVVFESHNYAKISNHWLLPLWVRLINRNKSRALMVVTTELGSSSYINRGVPGNRILVMPNGTDTERYEDSSTAVNLRCNLGIPSDSIVVGYCGSLYEGRGIDEILICAQTLKSFYFLIVGGSDQEVNRYKNMMHDKKVMNVIFIGHVEQQLVPDYLLASDILLMPYTSKTAHAFMSPMKLFDYLATGRPIIAADFQILHEIVQDKKSVIFVEPDSASALIDGIRLLTNDKKTAKEIGMQAKLLAQKFSWKNRASTIISWSIQNQF